MQNSRFTLSLMVVGLIACGGSRRSVANNTVLAATQTAQTTVAATEDSKPSWINRGSVAMSMNDGHRVFFGVGLAIGIKNPSLLRTTADDRARNEVAKIFEVFSASLMKDYANSSGEQNIEQAVKTAVSSSIKGVEIVDRYVGKDGTLYALAALDLARLKEVLAAEQSGAVKSFVTKVDVDDIFDKYGKKAAPPPPPQKVAAADAATPAADTSTKGDASKAKKRSGGKPAWVDGEDPNFPFLAYLCGVGFGGDRTAAENGSYAALARVFVAQVSSMSKDFMGAYSKSGGQNLEVQSSETLTKVATGKVFSGVQLMEVWDGKGTIYALSCMERAKAGNILKDKIAELDTQSKHKLAQAEAADKASRIRFLGEAMNSILERESLNAELRIIDVNGVGVSNPYSPGDVAVAFEEAVQALKVGVEVLGPFEEEFRGAFVKALTQRGYQVTDTAERGPDGLDVSVYVTIKVEDSGAGSGESTKNLQFADASVTVEIKNIGASKIIDTVQASKHRGHRNLDEAKRGAVRALATEIVSKVGQKIDSAMTGR